MLALRVKHHYLSATLSPLLLLLAMLGNPIAAHAACPPAGHSLASLSALKSSEWKVAELGQRQQLAFALVDCLNDANPVLRDELAFEALSSWMRGKQLDVASLQRLRLVLLEKLQAPTAAGFSQPFAALTLAEVARVDRLQPFMLDEERHAMVTSACQFLSAVRDYRGFDEREGWRHAVAHSADWLLQLALNPALKRAQIEQILQALASQTAPSQHFYLYGEGERLASAAFYAAKRANYSVEEWQAWTKQLIAPYQVNQANTQKNLALRHNLHGFLLPLYFMLQQGEDANLKKTLLPAVTQGFAEDGVR